MQHPKLIMGLVITAVAAIVILISMEQIIETNDAGNLQVKQAAVSGTLTCRTEPGLYMQNFGTIHTYPEALTFEFSNRSETDGEIKSAPLETRFNDGPKATVSGSLRVMLPHDCMKLKEIHRKFKTPGALKSALILPAVRNALYFTGPHMTAAESMSQRRGEFNQLAQGQLELGVILTDKETFITKDEITGENKKAVRVVPKKCPAPSETCINGFVRNKSPFQKFGLQVTLFSLKGIGYDQDTKDQIKTQQKARMNIITVRAQAAEAEARATRAKAEGIAKVAETRAEQLIAATQRTVKAEADKAVAVLAASQKLEEAKLDTQAAAQQKKAKILRAEGDSIAAKKRMQADGALDKKLAVYEAVNDRWATAYEKQRPTPDIVFGGSESKGGNPATTMMQLLSLKAAKDLRLSLGVTPQ